MLSWRLVQHPSYKSRTVNHSGRELWATLAQRYPSYAQPYVVYRNNSILAVALKLTVTMMQGGELALRKWFNDFCQNFIRRDFCLYPISSGTPQSILCGGGGFQQRASQTSRFQEKLTMLLLGDSDWNIARSIDSELELMLNKKNVI